MKYPNIFILGIWLFGTFASVPALAADPTYYCRTPPTPGVQTKCIIAEKQGACASLPVPKGVKGTWQESTDSCKCNLTTTGPGDECVQLENPLQSEETDLAGLIGLVIKAAMGLIGAVTLVMFFWGGKTWVMAAGNSEKVKSGMDTMLWAAIGLIIVFASYLTVNYFIQFITGAGA